MTAAVVLDERSSLQRVQFLQRIRRALARRDLERATALCQTYADRIPQSPEALMAQAVISFLSDDLARAAQLAEATFEGAAAVREAADLAAVIHALAGDLNTAVYWGKTATTVPSDPDLGGLLPDSLPSLAAVLCEISETPLLSRGRFAMARGELARAEHWLRQHLAFYPESEDGHQLLACTLMAAGRSRAAVDALRAARHQLPANPNVASLLGLALTQIGRFDEADACHRWALALAPSGTHPHAARLTDALVDPRRGGDELAAGFQSWGRTLGPSAPETSSRAPIAALAADRSAPRTIGFFIGGEGAKPSTEAFSQILACWRSDRLRLTGFGFGGLGERNNASLQTSLDRWVDVAGVDPDTLAALVRGEGIDVLIDLAGFAAPSLLTAFGKRMAPYQVAWLNAPYGTGLACMDALLTDRFVDSELSSSQFRERLIRLELGCVPLLASAVADPIADLDACAASADADAPLLLAADATFADLGAETIACWAEILHRLPNATLLLADHDFRDPTNLEELIARFGNFGVSHRVDISDAPTAAALAWEADVVLLPLFSPRPEAVAAALRARRPMVCPAGDARHRRFAASLLHHLGLAGETVAADAAVYAELVIAWAEERARRMEFARTLPARLAASPAADPEARARDFAAAIEGLFGQPQASSQGAGARP